MRKRRQRLFRRPAVLAAPVERTPERHDSDHEVNEQRQTVRDPHHGLGSGRRCAMKYRQLRAGHDQEYAVQARSSVTAKKGGDQEQP